MADFLGRIVQVIAGTVVERFHQRRARGHNVLSRQRIVGKPNKIARAVEQSFGNEMHYFSGLP